MNLKLYLTMMILGMSFQAHALLELRFGTTTNYGDPATLNQEIDSYCGNCGTKSKLIPGFTADAILKFPKFPIGFGLRYEKLATSIDMNGIVKTNFDYTRTAVLLNYRLINKFFYLGPIASYGLADSSKLKTEVSGVQLYDRPATTNSSYTAGIEAGINLFFLTFGAEVGYGQIKAKSFKDDEGVQFFDEISYTGNYLKIHAGFSF